ncbi:MAG TPA: amino acid--tRNA ligase-related protein, partial [Pyrinomonadaceae bacterium]|nr:amino acid--tRNA ligase-related protein [Pyrinomonadaceae bacterium]
FRDEDLRADRQPEFSQLDVEMSFPTLERIYAITEGYFARVFRACLGIELPTPFPRMSYAEAMRRYGSDKPDLRFGMELQDLIPALHESGFPLFSSAYASERGHSIQGIVVSGGAALSRKIQDSIYDIARRRMSDFGVGMLNWLKIGRETTFSKELGELTFRRLTEITASQSGDAILIARGIPKRVVAFLGAMRVDIARHLKLIPENAYAPLWVTEFPMFEYDEEGDRYYAMHHPFTSALDEDLPLLQKAVEEGETALLGQLRAKAYDTVINGVEVAGGSIRIHRRDVQRLIFKALGMSEETARERFGFFLDALEFGTPPHGGIASGIERTMMVLANTENIRDVMAFPKTASAADLMIDAPGEVDPHMLADLHVRIDEA